MVYGMRTAKNTHLGIEDQEGKEPNGLTEDGTDSDVAHLLNSGRNADLLSTAEEIEDGYKRTLLRISSDVDEWWKVGNCTNMRRLRRIEDVSEMDRAELKGSPVRLMVVIGMSSDVDDGLHGLRN
ncbi:hypothetical protein NQ317_010719 [Molorchus minor]|uniref:Uncharacterized protein n=1 Tax=Molorchus minor TaxID=1323400 RepID=A0ABQ9K7G4_9CUCU|nr:hypothetical protein NQ317_010719 [Molorchus minor]